MLCTPPTDLDDVRTAVQAVVLDVLRRRAAGESLPDEQVIASRPELAEYLREELAKLQQICAAGNDAEHQSDVMLATADMRAVRTPGMLQLQCPHCREPFETETDTPVTEILCSTCGGHFSLAGDDRETRFATSLKSLAHFDLVERLGVGGFGTVWKARDRKLDRTVAVKIPRQGMLNNDDLEKFLREARAAAQLQHPSIVRVHEVGRDGDSVFIVSDFVRGIPLNEWLTGQQPTMRQAAEICIAVAEALQHAHDRGVIHRDLKPANILIDGDGRPHLMDFGLARREVGEVTLTIDGQVLGTPAYMSPEQAQGEAHTADARSDIYSLGVILFQLLTGELPFRGSARMLMHQVIHDEPPSPRKLNAYVPRDLETITLKCIEKSRDSRYQSAADFAAELRRWLSGESILARPIGPLRRFWRWYLQRTALVAGACTLFTGIFVVAGVLPLLALAFFDSDQPPTDWREEWRWMLVGLLFYLSMVLVFVRGGIKSIRGNIAGLVLSAILFGAMALTFIMQLYLQSLRPNDMWAFTAMLNGLPSITWYVLGLSLQIVALIHQIQKHREVKMAQCLYTIPSRRDSGDSALVTDLSPFRGRIVKGGRWLKHSPTPASMIDAALFLGVLAFATFIGWSAYRSIAHLKTLKSVADADTGKPVTRKSRDGATPAATERFLVDPPTAELRQRLGSKQTVLMRVARVGRSPNANRLFLNSTINFRAPNCFTIVIENEHVDEMASLGVTDPDVELLGAVLRVTGEITEHAGRVQVQVIDPKSQLEILRNYGESTR